MTLRHFSNFCRKNFADLIKEISCTYVTWFLLITAPKLYKNLEEPFCQAGKLFSAEIWKMSECHFWADVMLRQSRLRASRASPAPKSQGLRVVWSKNFSGATFLVFKVLSDQQTTLKRCDFWAGEALEARTWDCLNITLAQKMTFCHFSNFCRKKFSGLTKEILCTY